MVPDHQEKVRLGCVLRSVSRPVSVLDAETYRLLGVRWYGNGCHEHSVHQGRELKTKQLNLVQANDVVYNKMWTTKAAFAVAEQAHHGLVATSEYPTFVADLERLFPPYLRAFMTTEFFLLQARDACQGSTSRARLNPSAFLDLSVRLPPLPEQKKIAAILSSVDEVIAKTESVIAQLQIVKKAMMEQLLTKGMPGRHTRFKQTEIGEIPEEWEVVKLRDVSQVVRGSTPRPARDPRYFSGDHTPWITVSELARDDTPYLTSTAAFLTEEGAKHSRFLSCGTVVMSNSGFGLGVPKILQISGCANDGVAAFLHLSHRVLPLFLYYSLAMRTEMLRNSVARGVDQPNLNTTLIGDLSLQLPSLEEQTEIVRYQTTLDLRLGAERTLLRSILSVKTSLSSSLLSGEIRVIPGVA